jgi:chorismate-pyruvate lyase
VTETTAHALSRRHFVLQDQLPAHVAEVSPIVLDPYLRGLLFTDGTVTRTLEVRTLSHAYVRVLGQTKVQVEGDISRHLEAPEQTEAIRRRVAIGTENSAEPVIWAESHILPSRLPVGFLDVLDDARDGIGESLQRVALESWRDMLWFGLAAPPKWCFVTQQTPSPAITRLYRVVTHGQPALLISESFAVEHLNGTYSLRASYSQSH